MQRVNILSASVVRKICRTIVQHLNTNCNLIPNDLYVEYQRLPDGKGFSIQDLPEAIKVKEYIDGVSFEGQYVFALYYRTYADTGTDRENEIELLDDIGEWLENNIPTVDEAGVQINYIRQNQSSYVFLVTDDGAITYRTLIAVNFDKL